MKFFDIWSDWPLFDGVVPYWWGAQKAHTFEEACREFAADDSEFRRVFDPLSMRVAGYPLRQTSYKPKPDSQPQ